MQRLWSALQIQWGDFRRKGHSEWWRSLKAEMDLGGLDDSYTTLGFTPAEVNEGVSATQLRKRRNQLALKYHPDKSAEGLTPLERDTKFAEIQKVSRLAKHNRSEAEVHARQICSHSSLLFCFTRAGLREDREGACGRRIQAGGNSNSEHQLRLELRRWLLKRRQVFHQASSATTTTAKT
jgi:hypothetical protein